MAAPPPDEAAPGRSITRLLLIAGASVLVLAAMFVGAYLVNLIALSVLITLLLTPVHTRLRARGMRSGVALLLCLALYVAVLGVAAVIVLIGLIDFRNNLEDYRLALTTQIERVFGPTFAESFPSAAANLFEAVADSLVDAALLIGYSVIVVAYLLLEAPNGERRILWAAGGRPEILERSAAAANRLRGYVLARTVLGLAAAVLDTIVLVLLGVPSALLWGVLSFLFSFVPNIGFILALIPPTVVAFAVNGPASAAMVVIAYAGINVLIDYILQPRYIGATVDLSPLVVTLAIVFWGIVLGPAGALLAVPMTIAAVAVADYFADSRPFARLLMEDVGLPATTPEETYMKRHLAMALAALVIAGACALLPIQALTMEVDGVPVTCRISNASIESDDTLGPGPETQTLCRSRAREAVGTVLGAQPDAQIESVEIGANGSATVCYTVLGVRSCPQVLPAMPTL